MASVQLTDGTAMSIAHRRINLVVLVSTEALSVSVYVVLLKSIGFWGMGCTITFVEYTWHCHHKYLYKAHCYCSLALWSAECGYPPIASLMIVTCPCFGVFLFQIDVEVVANKFISKANVPMFTWLPLYCFIEVLSISEALRLSSVFCNGVGFSAKISEGIGEHSIVTKTGDAYDFYLGIFLITIRLRGCSIASCS